MLSLESMKVEEKASKYNKAPKVVWSCHINPMQGCGEERRYMNLTEKTVSPLVLLQHYLHQMSKYYFTLREKNKQTNKKNTTTVEACFQAHWKNKNNHTSSHCICLSPSSVCLFTWKINGKTEVEMQHKASIKDAALGHSAGVEVVKGKSPVVS